MRQVHNQQMYPASQHENNYNEEDDSMVEELDIPELEGIVEGVWAIIVQ